MFGRYTHGARSVLATARAEAECRNHRYIGSGHLMLAVAGTEDSPAAEVLREAGIGLPELSKRFDKIFGVSSRFFSQEETEALHSVGIDVDAVLTRIEEAFGPDALKATIEDGQRSGRKRATLFTPGAKQALENSLEEARALGHKQLGAEHILLGLLRDDNEFVRRLADTTEYTVDQLRTAMVVKLTTAA